MAEMRPDSRRVLDAVHALPAERLAFSKGDILARSMTASLMREAGLGVVIDDAFNVVGSLPGQEGLASIALGSHLDSVPSPGRFDGALGVMCAIECGRLLSSTTLLRHPLQIFAFSDEEGSLTQGCWGARAITGQLDQQEIDALKDTASPLSQELRQAAQWLSEAGWVVEPQRALRVPAIEPAAYVELHVEQGPVLEAAGVSTAAVTSIVGISRYEVIISGQSGHAGTVPMSDRTADVTIRLARLLEQLWSFVLAFGADAVVNFGSIRLMPGSFNVIPEEARVGVEWRSPNADVLMCLEKELERLADDLGARVAIVSKDRPVALDSLARRATTEAAAEAGVSCLEMPSWAGHDAAVLAPVTRAALIFVPSVGGASHCRREHTRDEDVDAGLRVLLGTVLRLDEMLP